MPQIITSPSGERLVVMPEAEYHALVEAAEDNEDRMALAEHRRAVQDGSEHLATSEEVDRLLSGTSAGVAR